MIITEDRVSFEIAKLLKDKGADLSCTPWYAEYTSPFGGRKYTTIEFDNEHKFDDNYKYLCSAPTIQMAMKWLRKVHNIMISPYALSLGYYFEIFDLTKRDITGCKPLYKVGIPNKEDVLGTYEEACEAAIKYCLENISKI